MQLVLLGVLALAHAAPAAAPSSNDCVSQFVRLTQGRTYSQKKALIRLLGPRQMRCLFENSDARGLERPEAFVRPETLAAGRVERYSGRNSLPVLPDFEKHFFLVERDGQSTVAGYNVSAIGRLTHSPGFFVHRVDGTTGETLLAYDDEFADRLTDADLARVSGVAWDEVRGNGGNLIFGDLVDVMHRLDDDLLIGQAYQLSPRGRKYRATFILLRRP